MLEVSGRLSNSKTKKLLIIGAVVIVLLLAVAGYFFWQSLTLKNNTADNKQSIARITSQVSSLLQVPTDEEPKIAQITEPENLKSQPFYADAQKDDYVLVYKKAKLAILYREQDHKLINVDHVELTPDQE